jgi:hypothetical protein
LRFIRAREGKEEAEAEAEAKRGGGTRYSQCEGVTVMCIRRIAVSSGALLPSGPPQRPRPKDLAPRFEGVLLATPG